MQEIGLNEPIDGEYLIYRGTKTPNQGFDSSIGHIIQKRTPRYGPSVYSGLKSCKPITYSEEFAFNFCIY